MVFLGTGLNRDSCYVYVSNSRARLCASHLHFLFLMYTVCLDKCSDGWKTVCNGYLFELWPLENVHVNKNKLNSFSKCKSRFGPDYIRGYLLLSFPLKYNCSDLPNPKSLIVERTAGTYFLSKLRIVTILMHFECIQLYLQRKRTRDISLFIFICI